MRWWKQKYSLVFLLALGILLIYLASDFFVLKGPKDNPTFAYIQENNYHSFNKGRIYRFDQAPPMLELEGNHYEIGLQYGVLLYPEIKSAVLEYKKIFKVLAKDLGIPQPFLLAYLKFKALGLYMKLPKRFQEEIKGVSEGSTVPEITIIAVSLLYDVLGSNGCTGLLMRSEDGSIIHGRSQEPFGFGFGGLFSNHTVVVKQKTKGFHEIVRMEIPLFMGVETGYNQAGIGYSEETYAISEPYDDGFPIVYLARLILEEVSDLEKVVQMAEKYTIGVGSGMIWSDRKAGRGLRLEKSPKGQVFQPMENSILWNFNNFVDSAFATQEPSYVKLLSFNRDREKLAAGFPKKPSYDISDAVSFFRLQTDETGSNYSWSGSKSAIANAWGQQTIIFDPKGYGFYMSLRDVYSAMGTFLFYSEDFSIPPKLFMTSELMDAKVKEAGRIQTGLFSKEEKLEELEQFAGKYPDDPNAQFLVAEEAFKQEEWEKLDTFASRCISLAPEVNEYRFYGGMAAYLRSDFSASKESLNFAEDLSPIQEIYRLTFLKKMHEKGTKQKEMENALVTLIENYQAMDYYESTVLPKIQRIEKANR
ncbi:C45 family autoproteolytic acyltransferase/hydolase [Lunatibacter salilacus]|uniref:C45 family autoproteolytic acyltransferase/hydolase n=1 Tax=Lunatibacter salilacus TaxID=2483804 RepID=UPI00131E5175|nr:C45 family autoproteolytic acyltransferase/hydolase [Lunatibacter salilacus]